MSYSEMDTDILLLAANGLEHAAKERLREMTPEEWRELEETMTESITTKPHRIPACAPRTPANYQPRERHSLAVRILTTERTPFAPSTMKGHFLKTQVNQSSHRTYNGSREYRVTTDKTELPHGSFFTVLPGVPVQTGDLILFCIGGNKSIGRWRPNIGGLDWIQQPGRLIACVGDSHVWILGPVVLCPPLDVCHTGTIKAKPESRN